MSQTAVRRPKLTSTGYNLNVFHLRNPYVIAWWSLAFPGFGHIALGSIIKGVFLFIAEIAINQKAHINMAIIYSFVGDFELAKQVLDTQWLLLYTGALFYGIWDCYRLTLEYNKMSVLGDRENADLVPIVLGAVSINGLEKRTPWVSFAWSIITPGLGQLYNADFIKAIFLVLIGAGIICFSHSLQAIHYSFLGDFAQAKAVLDWQLALNIPSFYGFAIFEAYVKTVEFNKLFDQAQAQYFRNNFQNPNFDWAALNRRA
ncbi:MAG: hypothetical protein ABFD18_20535 [Syntrophomonas sp.]